MQRYIFIHGYVEDATVFDNLRPLLPAHEPVLIDLEAEFSRWNPAGTMSVVRLAEYLVKTYSISASDVLIGHSMGGWISIHIKQITNCKVIQLGSWTDQSKLVSPTHNLGFLLFMVKTGIMQGNGFRNYAKKQYPFDESREMHKYWVDEKMGKQPQKLVAQQVEVLFRRVPPLTVSPDLRVHAKPDNIVHPPDEAYNEVPGDHFSLYFHAPIVAEAVRAVLV
jgi:hypothetical protein